MSSPIRIAGLTLRYLGPLVVIAIGVFVAKTLIAARSAPPKRERPARVLPVETARAVTAEEGATLSAFGTVEPLRRLVLRPTVTGPVVSVHPNMIAGGLVAKGDVLVTIDPRDFELAVARAEAALVAAKADLDIERGNANVAAKEFELLESTLEVSDESKRLALREPFIERRVADVHTREAELRQAELDLERTKIVAPFDAVVLSESVEVGAILGQNAEAATLVDRSVFAIEVSVPQSRLRAIDMGGPPALVDIDGGTAREASIERVLGEVDREGRMARLRVTIEDPLRSTSSTRPGGEEVRARALLGSYVEVELPLSSIPGAVAIPRTALREGDVVWLIDDESKLRFRDVEVALRRDADVLVTGGLEPGTTVITSLIAVPLPGMLVEPAGASGEPTPAAASGSPPKAGQ